MRKYKISKPHVALLIILLGVFLFAFLLKGEDFSIPSSSVFKLDGDWIIETDSIQPAVSSLPTKVEATQNQAVYVSIELTDDFLSTQTLLIRSSLQSVSVYLDGVSIYSNNLDQDQQSIFTSVWNFVEIPQMSQNKTLTLELISPYLQMSGTVNQVYYGGQGDLIIYLFNSHGLQLLISLIILMMGLSMMILTLIFNPKESKGSELIGLFAIFVSLWLLAESRMLQFFTGNQFILGSLAYIMLSLSISPMILYIKRHVIKRLHVVYTGVLIILGLNFAFILLAQLVGYKDFFETVSQTNIIIISAAVVIISLLLYEIMIFKNKNALNLFKRLMIILTAGVVEFINFFLGNYHNTSLFILIGLAVFMSFQIVDYLRVIIRIISQSKLAQQYQLLALQDQLTGSKNRMAFENDVEMLLQSNQHKSMRVIFFDLNNLKEINDQFGHAVGDIAIIRAFELIQDAFEDLGSCYRVGGDEFACLFETADEQVYQQRIDYFIEKVSLTSQEFIHSFTMAYGSAVYDGSQDQYFSDTMSRADQSMYQTKLRQKSSI